uniref:Uncharacterized protein n=1 Tax=Meloidogyne hapla TaxID=6305 RepID=A0A1I8C0C2_MELHA
MLYILIFYLILFQNENSLFSKANKLDEEDVKIISEFILFNKNIQTDIYAENVRNSWEVYRGFHKDNIKDLEITWSEMKKTIKNKDKTFFERTKSFFDCNGNIIKSYKLNFTKIFDSIDSDYLKLSNYYRLHLEALSKCLSNFLVKTYGIENVIGMKAPQDEINEETAILKYNRTEYLGEHYVFRWDWEKTKKPEPFPNIKYKKGTKEYQELNDCNLFLRFMISNPNL